MAFWALEVAPGKEFSAIPPFDLHLTQVVLPANATDNGRSVLQAKIDDKQFAVASLKLDRQENISLDLIFEAGKPIIFTVSGKNTVQLLGYYIDNQGGLSDDEDDFDGDSFGEFDEDEEVDSEEGDDGLEGLDDSDDEDDEELDEEEISKATLAQLQQKRKAQLEQPANGAKKAKVEPQQQKGQQQKGQPQQQQKGQQQAQQQKGQQQKGDQKQQQKPQTPQQNQQRPQTPKQDQKGTPQQQKEQKEGGSRSVGGVKIDTMVIGTGAQAQVGKKVRVMYTGRLENGKVFDKSRSPFSFRLGGQEVIKGWDIGVNGMRVGEKRKLTIPPQLGYGRGGAPPDIPGNATLIFDVELVGV